MQHKAVGETSGLAQHIYRELQRVGQHDPFNARMRDVTLVPEGDVLESGLQVSPQHPTEPAQSFRENGVALVRASPTILLADGEGLFGLATSLRARWRTSSANCSIAVPSDAHA